MELYGFMEREKKIPSYFFIITKYLHNPIFFTNIANGKRYSQQARRYKSYF